jgi:hypothetical protein
VCLRVAGDKLSEQRRVTNEPESGFFLPFCSSSLIQAMKMNQIPISKNRPRVEKRCE